MRKKYEEKNLGSNGDLWDGIWSSKSIEDAVRFCEFSPLGRVFEKYFPRRGRILEGGCGLSQYVIFYKRRGYDIEGVDFAEETIKRVLEYDPTLPVKVGDVQNLDYPDNSFDVYYSGGVVEHFEEGPFKALKEAHRVLKPGGIYLLTVPYVNPTRRVRDCILALCGETHKEWTSDGRRSGYALTTDYKIEPSPFAGLMFFEYIHEKREITKIVKETGFDVMAYKGIFILWGLMEFAVVKWLTDRMYSFIGRKKVSSLVRGGGATAGSENKKEASWKDLVKRLVVAEDERVILFRPMLSVLRWSNANLLLLVCKAIKSDTDVPK